MKRSSRIQITTLALMLLAGPLLAQTDTTNPPQVPVFPQTKIVTGTGSLTSQFASNNGFAGNTFDLENIGALPITITGFDVNLDNAGSVNTITIYHRPGTSVGFENNSAGWLVLGTDAGVTSNGDNVPTPVAIGGLTINPGEIRGMYVDLESYDGSTLLRYTNGGPTTYMNTELSLTTQFGKGNPAFTGASFFPREWNGTVYYDIVPVELQSIDIE